MHLQKHPTMVWLPMQQWAQEQLGITLRRSTAQMIRIMDAQVFMSINPSWEKSHSVNFPLLKKALIESILAKQALSVFRKTSFLKKLCICVSSLRSMTASYSSRMATSVSLRRGKASEAVLLMVRVEVCARWYWRPHRRRFSRLLRITSQTMCSILMRQHYTTAYLQKRHLPSFNWDRKKLKARITIALCSNASGSEKTKIFITEIAKSPRCLKRIDFDTKWVEYLRSQWPGWTRQSSTNGCANSTCLCMNDTLCFCWTTLQVTRPYASIIMSRSCFSLRTCHQDYSLWMQVCCTLYDLLSDFVQIMLLFFWELL